MVYLSIYSARKREQSNIDNCCNIAPESIITVEMHI